MRARHLWFVAAAIAAIGVILIPILHLSGDWVPDLLGAILVVLTIGLLYAAYSRKRLGLRMKLVISGNLVAAAGLFSWGSIGQNLLYAGLVFWFVAYIVLWVAPNKGLHGDGTPGPH